MQPLFKLCITQPQPQQSSSNGYSAPLQLLGVTIASVRIQAGFPPGINHMGRLDSVRTMVLSWPLIKYIKGATLKKN